MTRFAPRVLLPSLSLDCGAARLLRCVSSPQSLVCWHRHPHRDATAHSSSPSPLPRLPASTSPSLLRSSPAPPDCFTVPLSHVRPFPPSRPTRPCSARMKRRRLLLDSDDDDVDRHERDAPSASPGTTALAVSSFSSRPSATRSAVEDAEDLTEQLPHPPPPLQAEAVRGMKGRKAGKVPIRRADAAYEEIEAETREIIEPLDDDGDEEKEGQAEESDAGGAEGAGKGRKRRVRLKKASELSAAEAAGEELRLLHAQSEAQERELLEEERQRKAARAEAKQRKRKEATPSRSAEQRRLDKNAQLFSSILRGIGL